MSIEQIERRRGLERGVKLTMSELIAGIGLLIAVLSALNGWIVLPEQVRAVQNNDAKQDARIELIQKEAVQRNETLARIDERTKRIEDFLQSKGY